MTAVSPMMQQYHDAKAACPDALLLFRMGDFYELFHEDAKTAARVLGLTLTSRDKGENPVPMAGFPHHQLENYLGKLIGAGLRAAICDQVEDPRKAKGIVKRELTRIVSPGTVTDDALLDPRESNYLAAIVPGNPVGLAWVDLSTGRFLAAQVRAWKIGRRTGPHRAGRVLGERRERRTEHARRRADGCDAPAGLGFFASQRLRIALRQFGTQSLEGFGFDSERRRAGRFARQVRFSITWPRHKRLRSNISTGSSPTGRGRRWRSTRPAAAVWKSAARCVKGDAKARFWL